MDLTKKNNCYTKWLCICLDDLKEDYSSSSISVEDMKQHVLDIIAPTKLTPAKKRFIGYLTEECYTKLEIYNLCYSSVQKAKNYDPAKAYLSSTYTY
jgi:hypothetical protein